jgi:transcription elongation factor GreA
MTFFIITKIFIEMANYTYLTQEGFDRLTAELEEMKSNGRREISLAIAEAREKGDLSENAEYHAAKDAQGMLEMKINKLERSLANARVIDESQLDDSKVVVLSNVTIKNLKSQKEVTYKLVSAAEANLKEKKISVTSPIGEGLLGKEVGDTVQIQTPAAIMEFEIINISL